jgi:hypothetical protein
MISGSPVARAIRTASAAPLSWWKRPKKRRYVPGFSRNVKRSMSMP